MKTLKRYSPEVRERAVRMVLEQQNEYTSQWAAIQSIASKIGCTHETLRRWVQQAEVDQGIRGGMSAGDREWLKQLEREKGAQAGSRDPADGIGFFRPGGARPQTEVMIRYIDDYRNRFGVESICKTLPIAPSTYYEHKPHQADPGRLRARGRRDAWLMAEIQRVWQDNFRVYGARKV